MIKTSGWKIALTHMLLLVVFLIVVMVRQLGNIVAQDQRDMKDRIVAVGLVNMFTQSGLISVIERRMKNEEET
jgi:hypothetical protein